MAGWSREFWIGAGLGRYQSPKKLGEATQMLYVKVNDADEHFARAKKAGAKTDTQEISHNSPGAMQLNKPLRSSLNWLVDGRPSMSGSPGCLRHVLRGLRRQHLGAEGFQTFCRHRRRR